MVAVEEVAVGGKGGVGVLVHVLLDVHEEVANKSFVSNRRVWVDLVEQWGALLVDSRSEQVGQRVAISFLAFIACNRVGS